MSKDRRYVIIINMDNQVYVKDGSNYYKFIYSDYHTEGLKIDGLEPNVTIEFTGNTIKEIRDINTRKYVGQHLVKMVVIEKPFVLKQFDTLLNEKHLEKFKKIEDKDVKWDIIEFIDKHRTLFNYNDLLIY